MLAPGYDITSSVPGDWFIDKNGTSMAAPHVAGAVAMIKHVYPGLTPAEILTAMKNTGEPIFDNSTGKTTPRIQVDAAIDALSGGGGGGGETTITVKKGKGRKSQGGTKGKKK